MADSEGAGPFEATVTIRNVKGLHALASAKFVTCAGGFEADVRVSRDGHCVAGTSILGLMMLAAGPGSTLHLKVAGKDAAAALKALIDLVENGFGEACVE